MPTGGVSVDEANLSEWFKAGVSYVGMGSQLISKKFMQERDYKTIAELTKKALEIIKTVKNN